MNQNCILLAHETFWVLGDILSKTSTKKSISWGEEMIFCPTWDESKYSGYISFQKWKYSTILTTVNCLCIFVVLLDTILRRNGEHILKVNWSPLRSADLGNDEFVSRYATTGPCGLFERVRQYFVVGLPIELISLNDKTTLTRAVNDWSCPCGLSNTRRFVSIYYVRQQRLYVLWYYDRSLGGTFRSLLTYF